MEWLQGCFFQKCTTDVGTHCTTCVKNGGKFNTAGQYSAISRKRRRLADPRSLRDVEILGEKTINTKKIYI